MTKKVSARTLLAASLLSVAAFAAQAQTQAPGLWEHTIVMKGAEMQAAMSMAQQQLASLPPEQRKQVEAMMAKNGMKLGPQGNSVQICITPEQAARPPEARLRGGCKQTDMQRSGRTMTYKFECAQPPSKGDAVMTYASDKAYSGSATIDTSMAGRQQHVEMEMSGKWLSATCGDVKPAADTAPAK